MWGQEAHQDLLASSLAVKTLVPGSGRDAALKEELESEKGQLMSFSGLCVGS